MNIKTEIQKLVREALLAEQMSERPTRQQEYRQIEAGLDDLIGRMHVISSSSKGTLEGKRVGRWIDTLQLMRDAANELGKYEEDL